MTEKPIFAKQEEKHKKSEKDSAGEAVGFRGIVRDITERKRMEATLKKARNELEQRVEERTKELLKINKQLENEINERRQAEETLKEQTKTLNNILEKAADGICVCHNISEEPYVRFTHWNPRMTEITGYSIEEINRFGWHQLKSLLYNLNAISD